MNITEEGFQEPFSSFTYNLVGGFNPLQKQSHWIIIISPNRDTKKHLKPPTSNDVSQSLIFVCCFSSHQAGIKLDGKPPRMLAPNPHRGSAGWSNGHDAHPTKVQAVMIPTLLVILSVFPKNAGITTRFFRIVVLECCETPKEEATVCVRIQKSNSKLMRNWRIPILPGFQNELQTCFFSFWLGFLQNFHRFRSYPYDDANDPLVCLYIQAPAGSF